MYAEIVEYVFSKDDDEAVRQDYQSNKLRYATSFGGQLYKYVELRFQLGYS